MIGSMSIFKTPRKPLGTGHIREIPGIIAGEVHHQTCFIGAHTYYCGLVVLLKEEKGYPRDQRREFCQYHHPETL